MFVRVSKIPVDASGNTSRLYQDYVRAGRNGLKPFLGPMTGDKAFWEERAQGAAIDRGSSWSAVVDDVRALSERCGSDPAILQKLDRARDDRVHFVVTGQQPGVLGGPLLTLYKVLTAVALAERLEALLGTACVPLYWCGSDDTDFREIRSLHLVTTDAAPLSAELPQESHPAGLPVGDIESRWNLRLWQGIRDFAAAFDAQRAEVVDGFIEAGADHGEIAARVICHLLGGRVAIVDGRSSAVRRHARDVFARYVRDEEDIKRMVREGGERLDAGGYHAQISTGSDSGVFLMEDGRRKTVSPDNRAALVEAVEQDVARCSPGVVLRNLIQDYTFQPLAAVLGPAEIAYRAQISSLYDAFAIARPVDFPRLSATFVPSVLRELLEGADSTGDPLTVDAVGLIRDPAACTRQVYSASVPASVSRAAEAFRKTVEGAVKEFANAADDELSDQLRGRIRARLKDVESRVMQTMETVEAAGKRAAVERWPFLPELGALFRPEDKLQERYYSCLVPFLFGGSDADASSLIAMAEDYMDELLDGDVGHILYSTQ